MLTGLLWCDLSDLALVDLLVLLDSEPNGPSEVLHQDLGLLDLGRVNLRSHHGAEGNLGTELSGDTQRQGRFACSRGAREEQSPAGHLLRANHLHNETAGLPRGLLSDKTARHGLGHGLAVLRQAEALDVGVRRNALRARRALDLLYPHG